MSIAASLRHGGPDKCPTGPCSECTGPHHFTEELIEFAEDEPDHEAAKLGLDDWMPCKHCDAWQEYVFSDEDDDDEADDDGTDNGNDGAPA